VNHTTTRFFPVLKAKVDSYFESSRLSRSGGSRLLSKALLQFLMALALYTGLLFLPLPGWALSLGAVLLGINLAVLGFNVMHEGGHQSFSRHAWVNSAAAYMLNVLGGNTYYWKIKHNVNHHTHTNVAGMDSDINVEPFMRLHPNQPLRKIHRYQYLYWVLLYGISYIAWVFYEDFVKYFSGRVAVHMPVKRLAFREHLIFWLTKVFYVTVYLVLPVAMLGWATALVGFLIVTVTCGLFISVVFQLAHVVESTDFPTESKVTGEWALHQIRTTSNFATDNRFLFWLLGGLNFQVEHHLFPKISHIHYPQINKLVKQTCREFDVCYHEYATMYKAFTSHLKYLQKMGVAHARV
jgi:linoleoyl-CoA desaturase